MSYRVTHTLLFLHKHLPSAFLKVYDRFPCHSVNPFRMFSFHSALSLIHPQSFHFLIWQKYYNYFVLMRAIDYKKYKEHHDIVHLLPITTSQWIWNCSISSGVCIRCLQNETQCYVTSTFLHLQNKTWHKLVLENDIWC